MSVKSAEALAVVKRAANLRRLMFSGHFRRDRSQLRNAEFDDVYRACLTATAARFQPDNQRWQIIGGVDLNDDGLTVVVAIDDEVVVVTVLDPKE